MRKKFYLLASSNYWGVIHKHVRKLCTNSIIKKYDVVVVGGGHAGTEACSAAARMGAQTLLITHKMETIGEMSCNPSFGGIGKGHLMREIDALDGVCGRVCDKSGVQYRVLNKKKGPAVWGLRAQIDRDLYRKYVQEELRQTKNLDILAATVEDLVLEESTDSDNHRCVGVVLGDGNKISSKCVIMTTGTFLRANINIGLTAYPAGRMGDEPSIGLADTLQRLQFNIGRLKTGTPPRIDGKTIDYSKLGFVMGDNPPIPFSFMNDRVWIEPEEQLPCYQTLTNSKVEEIIRKNMHLSRHVREEVKGPRYCPSIESKIKRFGGRAHNIWLEPEGFSTDIIYPGGLATTLPEELQVQLINSMEGLENAVVLRPGYGVEYEFVDPREITNILQTKRISNLFFAGQINGTTGYEEAAAQGILAGINAAATALEKETMTIERTEGYIGVLVDDLITHGTTEPYRMFTCRSEFRLSLRPDNADLRFTEKGFKTGCVSVERYNELCRVRTELKDAAEVLKSISMSSHNWRKLLKLPESKNVDVLTAMDMLSITDENITVDKLKEVFPSELGNISKRSSYRLKIESIYKNAVKKQMAAIEEIKRDEVMKIPENIDYSSKHLSLSLEEIEKLTVIQPQTIAAASRIPGMTPVSLLRLLHCVKLNNYDKLPTS